MVTYKHIGLAIRRRRLRAGFTQEALAARVGITRERLAKIESAMNRCDVLTLAKVAKLMRTGVDTILRDAMKFAEHEKRSNKWEPKSTT